MSEPVLLRIDGEVERPVELSFTDLEAVDAAHQVADVSQLVPGRKGDAVRLNGLLELALPKTEADYLTLHAEADDFHASVPLAAVRSQALLVYRLEGKPLPVSTGGPFRLLIPDAAACHTDEVDDCASVKFVDRIELCVGRGQDNRPADDESHEELHRRQGGS